MPGSSTTPGRPGTRAHAPVRIAFRLRNSVSTRDMNLYGAQWLAYALPCRRFAAALTDVHARLRVDVDRYSFIVSDLHRLLVAGLPAHCETFCTSSMLTLIQTAKLNTIDPQAWLADVLARIAGHKITDLAALLPWNWRSAIKVARAA